MGMDVTLCFVCSAPLPAAATGRPRKYCSRACNQKAVRIRRDAERETQAVVAVLSGFTAIDERARWIEEEHRVA